MALLKRAHLTKAKWQSPPSKRQHLCCGTGRWNQLLKCKEVTDGNMETSTWKTVHQAMVGIVSAPIWMCSATFLSWGDWTPSSYKRRPWTVHIVSTWLSYLQFRSWHTFNQTFSFNKMAPLHTAVLQWETVWKNISKQTDWVGRTNLVASSSPQ